MWPLPLRADKEKERFQHGSKFIAYASSRGTEITAEGKSICEKIGNEDGEAQQ